MRRLFHKQWMLAGCMGAVCAVPALAGPLPEAFTLGRCVPADSWMYVHAVNNPERAWINAEWEELFTEFKKSGVDRDLMTLFMSLMSDSDRADIKATIDKAVTLGLNYPNGPLKFGDVLGAAQVHKVLASMYRIYGDPRYRPNVWLTRRARLGVSLLTPEP